MKRIGHVIAGTSAGTFARVAPVFDPASGEQTAEVALASAGEVDQAVAAAKDAWLDWRHSSLATRTRILFAFRQLVDQHKDALAAAITSEHGKVLSDAAGEVARGLDCVEFACGIPQLHQGRPLPSGLHGG